MQRLTSLFLAQSYTDAWEEYLRSLKQTNVGGWDYVILTASNEFQAEGFRLQLQERKNRGFLPTKTHFAVIADPKGERVGSGGATLGVLKYISEHSGSCDFLGLRILVIHSGGDSKRVPQYSALGKLFSPVPHQLPNGMASTLFDEFMIVLSSAPGRIREGMLLVSGDVLLLFNPLQIDYSGEGAAAISFKEPVQMGKNHGVFLKGDDGNVAAFLHKQSVEQLREKNAVDEKDRVHIDTGAIVFSKEMLKSLYSLISTNGKPDSEKFNQFVNSQVRLSLYGDFLYPLASDSTLDSYYLEKPEGEYSEALTNVRTRVWEVLRPYRMRLLHLSPAKFIHFGTTAEIVKLLSSDIENYQNLGWSRQVCSNTERDIACYNSVVSEQATVGQGSYLESSYLHPTAIVGERTVLSGVEVADVCIPSEVVLHALKQLDKTYVVRIYGIYDNPKDSLQNQGSFLGTTLSDFMKHNGISNEELWDSEDTSLWNARLYPACSTMEEGIRHALNLYAMAQGKGDVSSWRNTKRCSLAAGFSGADSSAIIHWNTYLSQIRQMDRIARGISKKQPVTQLKDTISSDLTHSQKAWLSDYLSHADFSEKIRMNYYLGQALGEELGDQYTKACFQCIRQSVLENSMQILKQNHSCRITKERHTVKLPLRVNFGGGWSDTPPYCNENGGTVLNAAILLNGEKPVEVTLQKINQPKIVFDSRDMNVHGEFSDLASLQATGDPYDPFALQKAALLACGILPLEGGNLEEIFAQLGGGFQMNSEVTGVPKGSGLGTSSILSAACVKAIFEFFGIEYTEEKLYQCVLCVEQIMSTGGGWQDQVGGVVNGIKLITAAPGLHQKLNVEQLTISDSSLAELNERLALIYTGQRRLARNLLRDVVGRYIGNIPEVVSALAEIQQVARDMKQKLECGAIDEFADLMNQHWILAKQIDRGITNTLIDQIFSSVEHLIDGKLVCGAGGGGFLQVILKKGVTKSQLSKRLHDVFGDSNIDAWDCTIV